MTRKIIPLNDSTWRVGSVSQKPFGDENDIAEVKDWLPATVPGDVRLDLLRAGKISDPFFGMNNEESQWVDSRDWWYQRDLEMELEGDERAFLIFDGIDYQSAVFFNGKPLGRHVGMFSRQVYELPHLSISRSQISIRIGGSDALPKMRLSFAHKLYARLIAPLFTSPNTPFPDRYATLKCQMQFGWDFAPRMRTCGIWDDAAIVIARSVFIEDAWVKSQLPNSNSQTARIQVGLDLDSDGAKVARIACSVRSKNFSSETQTFDLDLDLQRGKQTRTVEFELQNAHEWNPWDRGDPNLYEMEISILSGASAESKDAALDSLNSTFGIRSFQLERRGAQKDPWTFIVNGKREFLRGANWVPLDAIPGRLTRADYATRLQQARDANINFLRVWGGGLREKRAFYDLCDELGILVWQEFPFAGAILDRFPRDRAFVDLVRVECGAIVRALRNHSALVVWCGGNEFNTRGNPAIVETLRDVVMIEDGTRPFKPASPYRDESHNWRVWHRFANVRDYHKDRTPFLSEFGLQSAPNIESLEKFLPPEKIFPPNRTWEYHHAESEKLSRYSKGVILSEAKNLTNLSRETHRPAQGDKHGESFISATQLAQAHALQIAIEHLRRAKARDAAGVAIWQLNDAWPAISWSVIDYYGVPKLAYYAMKCAYTPVLVSFEYALEQRRTGQIISGDLWIINDLRSSFHNALLSVTLNGNEIFSQRVDVESDSTIRLAALDAPLVEGENTLQLKLTWGPAPLCVNEYDLNYCDLGEINSLVALYVTLGNKLMR